jgi:tetratricopeptide (TPR) repeat protein
MAQTPASLRFVAMLLIAATALFGPRPAAAAKKPPPKPPTAEEQKRYKEALGRGRTLENKKDWTGALAAFNQSLAAVPNDATAYSEISVCAFMKKDYRLAEDAARKSVAFAANPKLRAASLYNLGRVQEDRGEKAAAIESYSQSLLDRPNKTVRERLLALDPKAAAATDPLAPKPMEGPFASLAKWCADTRDRSACETNGEPGESAEGDEKPPEFTCGWDTPEKTLDKPPAPYKEIRFFHTECSERGGDLSNADFYLAIKMPTGWYVAGNTGVTLNSMRQTNELGLDSLEVRDVVPGGAPEVVLRTTTSSDYRGTDQTTSSWMNVAGVGPSGRPSATAQILLERQDTETDYGEMEKDDSPKESTSGATLDAHFLPDGQLEIKGPVKKVGAGLDASLIAPLVGKHALLFP